MPNWPEWAEISQKNGILAQRPRRAQSSRLRARRENAKHAHKQGPKAPGTREDGDIGGMLIGVYSRSLAVEPIFGCGYAALSFSRLKNLA